MYLYGSTSSKFNYWHRDDSERCGICATICVKLYTIADKDKVLARKVTSKNIRKKLMSSYGTPQQSCAFCYKKLQFFKQYLRKYLYQKLRQTFEKTQSIALQDIEITSTEHTNHMSETKETSDDVTSTKHEYSCQCDTCQKQYGNLPLLLQVIEENTANEQRLSQSRNTLETSNEVTSSTTTVLFSEPSTSSSRIISSAPDTSEKSDRIKKQNKKELNCEHCSKTFSHRGDFNKHVRKHTKERPYSCTACSKTFSHTSNLHRHEKIHSGDKPFVCTVCDKGFNRKDKLNSHKRSRVCKNKTEKCT